MKFFYTSFTALFLFGLCLVEKELKKQALEAQNTEKDFVENPKLNVQEENGADALANFQNSQNTFFIPKLQFSEISVSDSTFVFNEAHFSSARQL